MVQAAENYFQPTDFNLSGELLLACSLHSLLAVTIIRGKTVGVDTRKNIEVCGRLLNYFFRVFAPMPAPNTNI
jgi:hypothetical protein